MHKLHGRSLPLSLSPGQSYGRSVSAADSCVASQCHYDQSHCIVFLLSSGFREVFLERNPSSVGSE